MNSAVPWATIPDGFLHRYDCIASSHGIVLATTFTLLALSAGELFSILFLLGRLKKHPPVHFEKTAGETNAVLSVTVPTTLSRLIGSFTYFLEPICYTGVLLALGYPDTVIETRYTIINAYTIPLMTMGSFLAFDCPGGYSPYFENLLETENIRYLIRKCFAFSFVPDFAFVYFYYIRQNLYNWFTTPLKVRVIAAVCARLVLYYLQAPVNAISKPWEKQKLFWHRPFLIFGLCWFCFL